MTRAHPSPREAIQHELERAPYHPLFRGRTFQEREVPT